MRPPACRAMVCPLSRTSSVGTAWTSNRCDSLGFLSMSTLTSLMPAGEVLGDLFEGGADHAAGAAPGGPQVDDDGHGGLFDDLGEVVVARVHHPR